MENAIDLLILPPHCLHILQPLDVGVFLAMKRALASETDAALWLDCGRISRVKWTEIFIRAREKAITSNNILAGWRASGLWPVSPVTVLARLSATSATTDETPHTPPQQQDLDLSLLESSPPDGTELRKASAIFNSAIKASHDLPSPAKRFSERMTRLFETTHSELSTLRKQVEQQQELLSARKNRTKGKRVALKGKFVFSTEEVLAIAKQAEVQSTDKRPRGRPRERPIAAVIESDEGEEQENISSDSDKSYILVAWHI